MTEVRIVTKFASTCASVASFFRSMPMRMLNMTMMMQRGCLAFLLVLLSSTIHYTAAQECLPNLNDGGVLEFWDMVPGRKFVLGRAVLVGCMCVAWL